MNLKGNDFLKLLDYTPEQIDYLLRLAAQLKAEKKAGIPHRLCEGKNVALIFEKTSTRTRSSFEVAAHDLGMGSTYLDSTGSQIGKKESIADTARVLSGMFDGIEYRGFGQCIVEELAQYASVPVWNGLTDEFHPTQILADFLTIREHFGSLENIHLVYMGDARFNMGNSLMVGCAKMGMHFTACAPKGYFPDAQLVAECQAIADARLHLQPRRGRAGRERDLYRHLGLHGRTRERLGRAHCRARTVSGQRGAHGACQRRCPVHALPAGVSRQKDRHRQRDVHALRPRGDGGHGRCV